MAKRKQATPSQIYQLKISLRDTRPPIWRRVLVGDTTTLHELHWIMQIAMGWTDSHLHQFVIGDARLSEPEFGLDEMGDSVGNEKRVRLAEFGFVPKDKFAYEYDFGDGWDHEITVEKVSPPEAGARYPQCVAGRRACPPEDVGGTGGYESFLEAIRDPEHEEHAAMLEWAGGNFDPAAFDIAAVSDDLREQFR